MGSFSTIIVIVVVIGMCIAGISIIQRREQEKARIRQQVSKFRYRANETGSILSNFSKIPIGAESRSLMLKYIQLNLQQGLKLMPHDLSLQNNLKSVTEQMSNAGSSVDSQRLLIPKDIGQLGQLIQQLTKLGKYLLRFKNIKAMDSNLVSVAVSKISLLIAEAKICAYIQQGQNHLAKHDYVLAQSNFQTAQQMLAKFSNKNSRLIALENDVRELVNSTPSQAAAKKLNMNGEQHQGSESGDQQKDDIFGPKKKW